MNSFTVLNVYDNGALPGTDLIGSKGQGFIIDIDGERTLFDTGRRGRYLMNNLGILRIKPESIDRIVISHGHYDHAGGLPDFLDSREKPVEVIVHPLFHRKRAKGFKGLPYKDIGPRRLIEDQEALTEWKELDEWTLLSDNMLLVTAPPHREKDAIGDRLLVKDGKGWRRDDMNDELSLLLNSKDGLVVITGCCHRGLLNLLDSINEKIDQPIAAVLGGLHMESFTDEEVDHVVNRLRKDHGGPMLYLNHCTGVNAITRMRETLGIDGVRDLYAGTKLDFEMESSNIFL